MITLFISPGLRVNFTLFSCEVQCVIYTLGFFIGINFYTLYCGIDRWVFGDKEIILLISP